MIRALWTAATGMDAMQLNMDVISNNLANVNTSGFKKSRAEFQDLLYQTVEVAGSDTSEETEDPTGVEVGLGVATASVQKLFTVGDLMQTGNELDLAIEGKGLFQVELPNGETAYTRSGALKKDGSGRLVTSEGFSHSAADNHSGKCHNHFHQPGWHGAGLSRRFHDRKFDRHH